MKTKSITTYQKATNKMNTKNHKKTRKSKSTILADFKLPFTPFGNLKYRL